MDESSSCVRPAGSVRIAGPETVAVTALSSFLTSDSTVKVENIQQNWLQLKSHVMQDSQQQFVHLLPLCFCFLCFLAFQGERCQIHVRFMMSQRAPPASLRLVASLSPLETTLFSSPFREVGGPSFQFSRRQQTEG